MLRILASLLILGLSLSSAAAQQRDDPRQYMDALRERDRIIYGNPAANDQKDKQESEPGYSQQTDPNVRQSGTKSYEESMREQGRDLYGREIPQEELNKPQVQEEPQGYIMKPHSSVPDDKARLMDSLNQRDRLLGTKSGKTTTAPKPDYRDPGPMRRLRVTVTDEGGNPVADAEVTVVTAALGNFKEGNTSSLGSYVGAVRCYVPGLHGNLVHKVRITSPQGFATRLFTSDPTNCNLTAQVDFVLQAAVGGEDEMLKQYRERQKRYEEEGPLAPGGQYRDPYQKDQVDPYEKRYPDQSYPGQYKPPAGSPGDGSGSGGG